VDRLEPVTPWAALIPDDLTCAQLALVGFECFSNGPGVIPLVRCHSRNADLQVSVDYQRSVDGTFADGEITVPAGQQQKLVEILDLMLAQLDRPPVRPRRRRHSASRPVPQRSRRPGARSGYRSPRTDRAARS
jgi:hypothetical protein